MAITFPLPVDDFFSELPITTMGFQLTDQRATAETRGGDIIVTDSGDRLWEGEVVLDTEETAIAKRFVALAELLGESAGSLFVSPEHHDASPIGAATLKGVRNGNELKLGNLAPGTTLRAGDFISFEYGANPTRYALHQIADLADAVAGPAPQGSTVGETNYVRVVPAIQPGYSTGTTVRVSFPRCKAIMKPNSLRAPTFSGIWAKGWSFTWRQTSR